VVGRRELQGGDDPGVGLGGEMRLEPVGAHGRGLVTVTGLRIDCRDDPVLGDLLRDAPGAFFRTGLDVLARDESKEADIVVALLAEPSGFGRGEDGEGVVHEPGDKGVAGALVGPLDDGLAAFVARRQKRDARRLGHRAADPSHRRDELGDGVLGGDGVVEDGRVEGSAVLCL
jgi:hypothetical protein